MSETREVKARLKIVYDGKEVDAGTAKNRISIDTLREAEEAYQKKLRERLGILKENERMSRDIASIRQQEAVHSGFGGSGGGGGGSGGGTPGTGGMLEKLGGLGSAARAAGAGAALAASFKFAQFTSEFAKTSDNPFLSQGERERSFTRMIRGGETLQDFNDTLTQRQSRMLQSEFQGQSLEARSAIQARQRETVFGYQSQQSEANARAAGLRGAGLAAFNPGDRSNVRGEQLYKEELALVGLREKALRANRESAVARKVEEESASRLMGYERQTAEYNRQKGELFAKYQAAEGPEKALLAGRIGAVDISLTNSNGLARQEAQRLIEARQRVAGADRANAEASLDVRRGQLSILEGRESTAAGQAANLASLGMAGRMQGKFALQFLQNQGTDFASPEIISAAQAYAPETTRKLLENAGGKYVGEARTVAPEEYRDDLSDIRGKVDSARQAIRADELVAMKDEAEKARGAVNDLTAILRTFATELEQVRKDIEIKFRKNNGAQ